MYLFCLVRFLVVPIGCIAFSGSLRVWPRRGTVFDSGGYFATDGGFTDPVWFVTKPGVCVPGLSRGRNVLIPSSMPVPQCVVTPRVVRVV